MNKCSAVLNSARNSLERLERGGGGGGGGGQTPSLLFLEFSEAEAKKKIPAPATLYPML